MLLLPDGELWSRRVPKLYKSMNNALDMTYFTVYLRMCTRSHTHTGAQAYSHIFTCEQMQTCARALTHRHTSINKHPHIV